MSHATWLPRKVKVALDETRILILASQILLGFQFQGVFRPLFPRLPLHDHIIDVVALGLIMLAMGLLIAPPAQHRIIEEGRDTPRLLRVIGMFATLALAPFALALGADVFLATERVFGSQTAAFAGVLMAGLALAAWYGAEEVWKKRTKAKERTMSDHEEQGQTPLEAKIEQMLTEARIMLPGAQALLGFQLAITFTDSFEGLSRASRLVHLAALGLVALTVICLISPAAFHRIAYRGEDTPELHAIGNGLLLAASVTLALGMAGDMGVVVAKALNTEVAGITAACMTLLLLMGLWHIGPFFLRWRGADG